MPIRIVREPCAVAASRAAASATRTTPQTRKLDLDRLPAERLQPAAQALVEVDLRLPAEDLPRTRDVGPADERIVHRQRLEHDLARGAGDADAGLGELEH